MEILNQKCYLMKRITHHEDTSFVTLSAFVSLIFLNSTSLSTQIEYSISNKEYQINKITKSQEFNIMEVFNKNII